MIFAKSAKISAKVSTAGNPSDPRIRPPFAPFGTFMQPSGPSALKGVLAPVLTPFDNAMRPDAPRFAHLCRWLQSQDCGLAMFGTNSEGNSLSVAEKTELLQFVMDAGVAADRTMPGTGSCALPDAVQLTRTAVALGCAGVLVLPPFYYKAVNDDGLFAYFSELIEQVGSPNLRLYLYHIPPVAQVGFSHALVERLLGRYPGIVAGMKDTGGDWNYTLQTLRAFGSDSFSVFAGTETILLDTLRAGGAGCISATANVNPRAIVDLFQRWESDSADAQQARLNTLRSRFASFPLIPAMKAAVADALADDAWTRVRPPLQALAPAQREQLRALLRDASFAMHGLA